ncbi:hypothetical protein HanRHA438_Chr01g0036071 [Helianthus annuus]|nr:hypothetical protein HanRHA438_Chr01g0036071 [Helianthus annuus]
MSSNLCWRVFQGRGSCSNVVVEGSFICRRVFQETDLEEKMVIACWDQVFFKCLSSQCKVKFTRML